jgi:hypothetical protein
MASTTTTATTLHPQFRPPSHPRAPRRIRTYPPAPRFTIRATAASTSAPAQREAEAGVPWGCEIESLESAASLERWLTASGLPEQRLALEKVDIGERGLVALKNVRNGEKLLFVPPSLVITADSVKEYPRLSLISSPPHQYHSVVLCVATSCQFSQLVCFLCFCRNGPTARWGR